MNTREIQNLTGSRISVCLCVLVCPCVCAVCVCCRVEREDWREPAGIRVWWGWPLSCRHMQIAAATTTTTTMEFCLLRSLADNIVPRRPRLSGPLKPHCIEVKRLIKRNASANELSFNSDQVRLHAANRAIASVGRLNRRGALLTGTGGRLWGAFSLSFNPATARQISQSQTTFWKKYQCGRGNGLCKFEQIWI